MHTTHLHWFVRDAHSPFPGKCLWNNVHNTERCLRIVSLNLFYQTWADIKTHLKSIHMQICKHSFFLRAEAVYLPTHNTVILFTYGDLRFRCKETCFKPGDIILPFALLVIWTHLIRLSFKRYSTSFAWHVYRVESSRAMKMRQELGASQSNTLPLRCS